MKKFSTMIRFIYPKKNLVYNHYLSEEFINKKRNTCTFYERYPLNYRSRKFDKPAQKQGLYTYWCLDNYWYRVGKPAVINSNENVLYYENDKRIKISD